MKRNPAWPVILVTEPAYFESILPRLRQIGKVILGKPDRAFLSRIVPRCDAAVIRVETVLDRTVLSRAKRLKLIASATTGVNHIDVDEACRRNIQVRHLHGTHTIPTAEHTMALLFSLVRRIPPAQEHMRRGGWERTRWIGTQLSGKTLGIVGLGRIGGTVARFGRAMGMKVLAYDPYVRKSDLARLCPRLAGMLRRCDVISIHAALTSQTRRMFGARIFRNVKQGTWLVNTARGQIVDSRALIQSLKSGRLAGAALDVYDTEPPPKSSPLRAYARRHGNLILTPHLGASTEEAVRAAADEIVSEVEKFFSS